MKTAIAVFCKTPGLSPVKTRLGADIGTYYAEEFYKLSLSVIEEVLQQVIKNYISQQKVDVFWAVAEREAIAEKNKKAFRSIWTGEGSLGERIYQIQEKLFSSYDQVIILGSDSPQITPEYVINAVEELANSDYEGVIGPCRDGGFVLFGSKKIIPETIWTEVEYSQEETLKQLISLLEMNNYQHKMLWTLGDVDQYDDLLDLNNDFVQMHANLLASQSYLFVWLQELLNCVEDHQALKITFPSFRRSLSVV